MYDGTLPEELESYLDSLVPQRQPELRDMETYAGETGFPIVGPASGQLCYLLARMVCARRVFELGSGYGYSTAWFARAVVENGGGEVYHVVWDADLSQRAHKHLSALNLDQVVKFHVAEAVQTLRETSGPFDLIFNDIDKPAYPDSLPVIYEKLSPGGVLVVDNLLWHGKAMNPANHEASTEAIRKFTDMITTSPDWITSLVPIRDGLLVAYKK